jgi:hypothetical protein
MGAWFIGLLQGTRLPEASYPSEAEEDRAELAAWALWLGLAFLAVGLVCRLHVYLLGFPMWRDEASLALNFAARDFRGLVYELDNFQVAPLLFLWIEKAVYEYLGASAELLRLVPFLAGLAGLILFWRLSRLCLTPLASAVAVGCLAVASSPIHLASMVKPYSLDLCLATLLLLLAVRYLRTPDRAGPLIALALVTPLAVAASYPVVFVAGAVGLVLLPVVWRQGGLAARCWFVAFNLLCGAAFLAHLRLVGREVYDPALSGVESFMADYWHRAFLPQEPLEALHWLLRCHVGHMLSYPLEWNGGGFVGLVLASLGARALYRRGQQSLIALCVLPFVLNFVAGALHRYPYAGDQRLEQHLVPGLCLLMGSGAAELVQWLARSQAGQKRWAMAVAGLLVLLALVGAVKDQLYPAHDAEAIWARDIAGHLRRELRPDDEVVLYQPERSMLDCVRWHLLPFAGQVRSVGHIDWPCLERSGGRLWCVHQVLQLLPPTAEPLRHHPEELLPGRGRPSWRAVQRVRFLTHAPGPSEQQVFHFCCDLHVLAAAAVADRFASARRTVRERGPASRR